MLTTTTRRRGFAPLALVLALGLGACGLSDDEQDAADSLATAMITPADPDGVKDAAPCVAEKWVGEVGTGALRNAGLLNSKDQAHDDVVRRAVTGNRPVDRRVATGYARAWYACADFDALSLDLGERLTQASDEDLDEYSDCLKAIDDEAWRRARVQLLRGRGDGNPSQVRTCRSELNRAIRA